MNPLIMLRYGEGVGTGVAVGVGLTAVVGLVMGGTGVIVTSAVGSRNVGEGVVAAGAQPPSAITPNARIRTNMGTNFLNFFI